MSEGLKEACLPWMPTCSSISSAEKGITGGMTRQGRSFLAICTWLTYSMARCTAASFSWSYTERVRYVTPCILLTARAHRHRYCHGFDRLRCRRHNYCRYHLQSCSLHQKTMQQIWPTCVFLKTKLWGSAEDLFLTSKYAALTGERI